jgi:hypothetical protein
MSYPAFDLPSLSATVQQLAGILPLTALIEFIDLPKKLHGFDLTGRIPLWNWPITPIGARLLLQTRDNVEVCCLDSFDRSATLHCIDGRFGDVYPSSAPTTTRLWLAAVKSISKVSNNSPNMQREHIRRQRLEVVLISPNEDTARPFEKLVKLPFWRRAHLKRDWKPPRYRIFSLTGWVLWIGAVAVSLTVALHVAAAYLILLPVSGLAVQFTHGGCPRRLLDDHMSVHKRIVIVTNSLNGSDWWLFYGETPALNSLLNKPLYRVGRPAPRYAPILLQALIVAQWTLAVGSCALQDWNAIIISLWLAFCICSSAYYYPSQLGAKDWLKLDCHMDVKTVMAEFSSRRSMLGAIFYLNPDTKTGSTNWMNPILTPCEERSRWESALLRSIADGRMLLDVRFFSCLDANKTVVASEKTEETAEYWYKFIQEGVRVGEKIEKFIQECADLRGEKETTCVPLGSETVTSC